MSYWRETLKPGVFFDITPAFVYKGDKDGCTPVHQFAKDDNSDAMEEVFGKIPDDQWIKLLTAQDRDGNTPMHEAVRAKNMNWLETVIGQVTDDQKMTLYLCENEKKETSLSISLCCGYKEIFQFLLTSLEPKSYMELFDAATDKERKLTPLHIAVQNGFTKISDVLRLLKPDERRQLLSMQDRMGRTALHLAVAEGRKNRINDVKDLLRSLDDRKSGQSRESWKLEILNISDAYGQTILHCIANETIRSAPLLKACIDEISNTGKDQKAKLFASKDTNKCTALHYAAQGVPRVSSDGNQISNEDKKILDEQNAEAMHELVKPLDPLNLVGILKIPDRYQQTALHYAVESCLKAVKILIEPLTSASINSTAIDSILSIRDEKGETILHWAALQDNGEMISHLYEVFPDECRAVTIKSKNALGETILHCGGKVTDTIKVLLRNMSIEKCKTLINAQDEGGNTVLHLLTMPAKREDVEMKYHNSCEEGVRALLENIGDSSARLEALEVKNNLQGSPLQYAVDMVKLAPEILREVAAILTVEKLVSTLSIELSSVDSDALTPHVRYMLSRLLPLDESTSHLELLEQLQRSDEQHLMNLKEVFNGTEEVSGKIHLYTHCDCRTGVGQAGNRSLYTQLVNNTTSN